MHIAFLKFFGSLLGIGYDSGVFFYAFFSERTLSGKSSKDQTANLEDVKSSIKKATRTQPFMFRESTFTVNSSQNGDPLLERPHTSINSSHKTHRPTKFQILPSIHESKNKALKASVGK